MKFVEDNKSLLGLHMCRMKLKDDEAVEISKMLEINRKL